MTTRLPVAGASQTRHRHHRATKGEKSASRAALLYCWTLRYVVKRRIIFFSLRFDGCGYRVRVGLASGDKDLCTIFFLHTPTYLSVRGEHVYIHTVNPTSLCCALSISTIPTTRVLYGSSRGVETLPPYRFFFLPFPCLEQIEEVEGKDVFLFRVGTRKRKRVIDTVQRSPTTFYFCSLFPFSAHAALQPTRGRLETCLCEGKKERGRGVSDGTFRLLRSGIDVPVTCTGCTVGCILRPYVPYLLIYRVIKQEKRHATYTAARG